MKRLEEQKHILYVLKNSNSKLRKVILREVKPEVIKALCEICINTLNGNIKIPVKCKNFLKKYKRTLRGIAITKANLPLKRKLLIQRGGFLPVLLGTLLSGIVGQIIEKTIK